MLFKGRSNELQQTPSGVLQACLMHRDATEHDQVVSWDNESAIGRV